MNPLRLLERLGLRKAPAEGAVLTDENRSRSVRLSWVWSTERHPDVNFGDALSAVVVSAIGGLPVCRASFGQDDERLVAIGTIGHALHNGHVHLWGTGFDIDRDLTGALNGYSLPPDTEFTVHAVRGHRSGERLRKLGLDVPDVYGDPAWFLPKIFPLTGIDKTHDLGVVVHISELDEATAAGRVREKLLRYGLAGEWADRVRIINTYTSADVEGIRGKVAEIVACRRILSTSLHGLVVAETYGIPCAWFATYKGAGMSLEIGGKRPIDHRMIDFYSGTGRRHVLAYGQPLGQATDWRAAMEFLDKSWMPLDYDGRALFDAFPLTHAVRFGATAWKIRGGSVGSNPY